MFGLGPEHGDTCPALLILPAWAPTVLRTAADRVSTRRNAVSARFVRFQRQSGRTKTRIIKPEAASYRASLGYATTARLVWMKGKRREKQGCAVAPHCSVYDTKTAYGRALPCAACLVSNWASLQGGQWRLTQSANNEKGWGEALLQSQRQNSPKGAPRPQPAAAESRVASTAWLRATQI